MTSSSLTAMAETPAYPFDAASFHQAWWDRLAPKFGIVDAYRDFVLTDHKLLKGFITLKELRIAGWNYGWGQILTPQRLADFQTLNKTRRWDYFRMFWSESQADQQAFDALASMGYRLVQVPARTNYVIDLSNGFEDYLNGLSYNSRRSFKRKMKKAAAVTPLLVEHSGPGSVDSFFDEFFKYHLPYWDQKAGHSYLHDAREREFIVAWSKALEASGHLRLQELQMNGETVTLNMSIVAGKALYWVLVINTEKYSDYIPGIVNLYRLVENAAGQGITRFDMGTGDYFYKIQAANRQVKNNELLVANPKSRQGRLYVSWLENA